MTNVASLRGTQNYIWSLDDVLGQGATGAVFKARHKKTGELYALKVFNQMSHIRPLAVQMREFDVLKKLNHENIVKLLAIEEESTTRKKVLVMELCTEGSLHNILDNHENGHGLEETEFLGVLRDVAAGMKHLYGSGIVHRDIKPGNIMKYVGEDGKAVYKLIDFGAARELEEEEQFMSLYGTEEYLHPDMYERAVLRRPIGKQFSNTVDLWSLGVTLYHAAAGSLPFRPYGGRKNRETMHYITTMKKSGVISGVQKTENGPIEWSEELPEYCQFSKGAKHLLVPILAGLMECDPEKMWTFEQFFNVTHSLLRKRVVHVFDVVKCSLLHVYIDPDQRMAKLQELLAAQTEITAKEQYLLFENVKFSDFIEPMELANNYPTTSDNSPMFLFQCNLDQFSLPPIPLPEFPQITTTVQLEQDVIMGKMCASHICYLRRRVNELIGYQLLLNKASNMYIVVLIRHLLQVQGFVDQFNTLIGELGRRHDNTFEMNELNVHMLRIVRESTTSNGVALQEVTEDEINELLMKAKSNHDVLEQLRDNTASMKARLDNYNTKLVQKKELSHQYQLQSLGCQPSDNCCEKMNILAKAVIQTLGEFRKNKRKRLTYNEEQIHKFEKSKLNIYVTKSLSVLRSHCEPNLKKVYRNFERWFQSAREMKKTLDFVEDKIVKMSTQQRALSEMLDDTQRQHVERFRELLERITPDSISSDALFKVPANHMVLPTRGLDTSMMRSSMAAGPSDGASTRVLVKHLTEVMQEINRKNVQLREALTENTSNLETLMSITLPQGSLMEPADYLAA